MSFESKLREWVQDPPPVENVSEYRRSLLADGEREELVEALLSAEHRLREGEAKPFKPVLEEIDGTPAEVTDLQLTLSEWEAHPECRRELLQQVVADFSEASVTFATERQARVTVRTQAQRLRLESLYHWAVEDLS